MICVDGENAARPVPECCTLALSLIRHQIPRQLVGVTPLFMREQVRPGVLRMVRILIPPLGELLLWQVPFRVETPEGVLARIPRTKDQCTPRVYDLLDERRDCTRSVGLECAS